MRVSPLLLLLVACDPDAQGPWYGGGTAVGNPSRTVVRPSIPVNGTAESSFFEALRCDGSTEISEIVDADFIDGEGPELPGGELCMVWFSHGGITGEMQSQAETFALGGQPLWSDEGDFVLELGEGDTPVAERSGLFAELTSDGIIDPIERSQGALVYGTEREEIEPTPASALLQVGDGGTRLLRTKTVFPEYRDEDVSGMDLYASAFGDGKWMVVGGDDITGGVSALSTDGGVTWTGFTHGNILKGVAHRNGVFVASSYHGVLEKFDGTDWSRIQSAPFLEYKSIASSDLGFLAVAGEDALFSTNGENWEQSALPNPAGFGAMAAAGSDDRWVVVGSDGYRATSVDGVNWTDETSGGQRLVSVAWNGSEFLAVGDVDSWKSFDGINWAPGPTKTLMSVVSHTGTFHALTDSGAIYTFGGGPFFEELFGAPAGGFFIGLASSEP